MKPTQSLLWKISQTKNENDRFESLVKFMYAVYDDGVAAGRFDCRRDLRARVLEFLGVEVMSGDGVEEDRLWIRPLKKWNHLDEKPVVEAGT